jgi:sortase A
MRFRRALQSLGWTVLACVLLTAGWAAYMVADPFAGQRQQALQQQLYRQWREIPAAGSSQITRGGQAGAQTGRRGPGRRGIGRVSAASYRGPGRIRLQLGQPFALIRIPALGQSWQFAIVQGSGLSQLALGPGHVPGTGMPGQRGNFVVAAHDVTAGNPFLHLATLRHPDEVYVYTRTHIYEYVVESERIVRYTDIGVEYPVPGHRNELPAHAMITLITCTPVTLNFTPWRIVVTGRLVRTTARA